MTRTSTFALTAGLALMLVAPAGAGECALEVEISGPQHRPVRGASLRLLENDVAATSDAEGRVCVPELAAGSYRALVVADGYAVFDAAVMKAAGEPARVAVELVPAFGEELVVTGTRTARKLLEVPVHVQQIGREAIEASAARTLADAVELTPGVRIESNCQSCNFSQVRLLGLEGPYSQILVDGQPTVSSLAMVYGIEQFPARMLENVEVVKGGGAAIYGAGAVGGVINLIPHAPVDTHATLEARFTDTGGAPGTSLSALADWSPRHQHRGLSVLGQLDRVEPSDRDGDGYSEVTRRELATLALRGEQYALADQARFHAEINFTEAERRGGELAGIDLEPHETSLTEAIDTQRLAFGLGWLHTVSPRFDYRLAASRADTDRGSYYGADFNPDAYGETDNPLWLADGQANIYTGRSTVTAGVNVNHERLVDRQPGYGRELAETRRNVGLYLQEDRRLGKKTTIVYGLRADRHSVLDEPVVSPRLALMLAPRAGLTLRFSFAEGFRAPEVFDEDLHIELAGGEPRVIRRADGLVEEHSRAWLGSAEWRPTFGTKGSASLELAAFRTDLTDLFDIAPKDSVCDGVLRPSLSFPGAGCAAQPTPGPQREFLRINAGGARVEGVELSASVRWGSRFDVQAGFVVQSSRFEEPELDFGSLEFFRTPEHHGTLSLRWRLPAALDLFLGARYTGSMVAPHYAGFIDADRLENTQTFLELDLNLSREFGVGGRELDLTVGVKNLTDAYQSDLDRGPARDASYVYGPRLPRSFLFGVRWEL